jgi:hypothetical protein
MEDKSPTPFTKEWHEAFARNIRIHCYWRTIDLNQALREELVDVDMWRINFTLTRNPIWDLTEKKVAFKASIGHDEKARYRPFITRTIAIPEDLSLADFLDKWTKDHYVVIYSDGDRVVETLKDGRRAVRMATLSVAKW